MDAIIALPGINGSGEGHWQTLWERRNPAIRRFRPSDWDRPEREDWMRALDEAVAGAPAPPLLLAHSLACLLVAHWAAGAGRRIRGAFLVSVPDPDGPRFPREAASFGAPPAAPLPFPALIVASTDDPYGTLDHAHRRAAQWGAGFVVAGPLGHINESSGLGDWPQGAALFEAFRAGTRG